MVFFCHYFGRNMTNNEWSAVKSTIAYDYVEWLDVDDEGGWAEIGMSWQVRSPSFSARCGKTGLFVPSTSR
jgi:hypothetical protein